MIYGIYVICKFWKGFSLEKLVNFVPIYFFMFIDALFGNRKKQKSSFIY
jgi:hypothetical protein